MNVNRKPDIIAGIGFMVLAAIIIWIAIPYGVQEPKKVKFAALSPSYYPRLVAYCLFAFGALLTASRLLKKDQNSKDQNDAAQNKPDLPGSIDEKPDNADSSTASMVKLAGVAIVLLLYCVALPFFGFMASSACVLLVFLVLAGERNALWLIILPIVLPVSLHYFFTNVANIPIPVGLFETLFTGAE